MSRASEGLLHLLSSGQHRGALRAASGPGQLRALTRVAEARPVRPGLVSPARSVRGAAMRGFVHGPHRAALLAC